MHNPRFRTAIVVLAALTQSLRWTCFWQCPHTSKPTSRGPPQPLRRPPCHPPPRPCNKKMLQSALSLQRMPPRTVVWLQASWLQVLARLWSQVYSRCLEEFPALFWERLLHLWCYCSLMHTHCADATCPVVSALQEEAAVSTFPSADASQNSSTGTTWVMGLTSSTHLESQAPRALGCVAAAVAGVLVACLALL